MKKLTSIILISTVISIIFTACSSSDTTNTSYDNGMSDRYYTDKEYRNNVDTSAKAYGVSPKEVEDSVERTLDAIH